MNLVIIGAGNVATHLSIALQNAGYSISQIYSRTNSSCEKLARLIKTQYTTEISEIFPDADVYFYCVKDNILPEIIQNVKTTGALHIHTSGSTEMNIFKEIKKNYGVLYPLQTFSKDKKTDFSKVPLFIEGSSETTLNEIRKIAEKLSKSVFYATSEQRLQLHISAVFACNFVNYMYDTACELISKSGFAFEVLMPLIEETADKIKYLTPYEAQTGPAVRFDTGIILKHITALDSDSDKQKIYDLISRMIFERHQEN